MEDGERESQDARDEARSKPEAVEVPSVSGPVRTEVFGEMETGEAVKLEPIVAVNSQSQLEASAPNGEDEEEISALREWFELIGCAGFWALILYLFFFQVSVVDGPSMQPNFMTNDRLVIDKITYRFSAIRRFDVVVFQAVDFDHQPIETVTTVKPSWRIWDLETEEHKIRSLESKDYIKRVIGLPGDKVEIKGCNAWINGVPLNEPEEMKQGICYFNLPNEFIVPPKHYFVMGDNRGDSKDSRSTGLGFIPESQIRGIARLRFMPLDRWQWFGRQ